MRNRHKNNVFLVYVLTKYRFFARPPAATAKIRKAFYWGLAANAKRETSALFLLWKGKSTFKITSMTWIWKNTYKNSRFGELPAQKTPYLSRSCCWLANLANPVADWQKNKKSLKFSINKCGGNRRRRFQNKRVSRQNAENWKNGWKQKKRAFSKSESDIQPHQNFWHNFFGVREFLQNLAIAGHKLRYFDEEERDGEL